MLWEWEGWRKEEGREEGREKGRKKGKREKEKGRGDECLFKDGKERKPIRKIPNLS